MMYIYPSAAVPPQIVAWVCVVCVCGCVLWVCVGVCCVCELT